MDIDQIRIARREMEDAIRLAVTTALKKFRIKTGLSPQGINIQMVDVTSFGDRERCYVVGEVCVDIPL